MYSEDGSNIYVVPGPQVGASGTNGARGSDWFTYSGSGTPTGITGMANGDFCLRSDGEVYEYISSAWSDTSINIKGAPGNSGTSSTNDLRLAFVQWRTAESAMFHLATSDLHIILYRKYTYISKKIIRR